MNTNKVKTYVHQYRVDASGQPQVKLMTERQFKKIPFSQHNDQKYPNGGWVEQKSIPNYVAPPEASLTVDQQKAHNDAFAKRMAALDAREAELAAREKELAASKSEKKEEVIEGTKEETIATGTEKAEEKEVPKTGKVPAGDQPKK